MGKIRRAALLTLAVFGVFVFAAGAWAQVDESKRQSLQAQIEALEREAALLDESLQQTKERAKTLEREIKRLNDEIKRRLLEIRRLSLAIRQAELDIQTKIAGIEELTRRIEKTRKALLKNIQLLYGYDQESLLVVFAKHRTISEYFSALDNLKQVQAEVQALVRELRETREALEREKAELEESRAELIDLRALEELERRAAEEKRLEKDRLFKVTKGRETEFQKLLTQKKLDLATLKTQLFYLERTGITAEDALKFAELAATRAGIRPAFLLALLEVETGRQFEGGKITAGTLIGSGNWRNDLYNCYLRLGKRGSAEAEKNAFFAITAKLNVDPDQMPVSRRPSYGCGGAMGPAQFLPTTWLRFESRTAELTGHNPPNPWNIEDAFTAAAIFLADAGATSKTREGELQAARIYISGRPNCPTRGAARYACQAYARRVLALAEDIERVI